MYCSIVPLIEILSVIPSGLVTSRKYDVTTVVPPEMPPAFLVTSFDVDALRFWGKSVTLSSIPFTADDDMSLALDYKPKSVTSTELPS